MYYNGIWWPMKKLLSQICQGKENWERAHTCYIKNRKDVGELMEVLPSGLHLMPKKHTLKLKLMELLYVEVLILAA